MAIHCILALILLLCGSSNAAYTTTTSSHNNFIECFSHHVVSSTNNVLYFKGTDSYTTLLLSSIRNHRFINCTSKPLLIVAASDHSHVQASVICGKKHGLRLRVRSGGHDYEGLSYRSVEAETFIVLDLNRLRSIKIDVKRREAWVEAGATLGELYYKISKASPTLAFPAGYCNSVGVGGHLSGGGAGNLERKYGLAADRIIDCWLVDVHGRILDRKSMGEDLFWAARGGGGGSFGVVLSFKVKLVKVPPKVTVFSIAKSKNEGAIKLLDRWQHVAYKLPDDLFVEAFLRTADDINLSTNRTVRVTFRSLYLGGKEKLVEIMNEEFLELGVGVEDCTEMSWVESTLFFAGFSNQTIEALLDRTMFNNPSKGLYDYVNEPISEENWELIWERFGNGSGLHTMSLDPYGGKIYEISESAIPFPYRQGIIFKIVYAFRWTEESKKASKIHLDWTRNFHGSMAPYVSSNPRGAYINARDLDMGRNDEVGKSDYHKARVWGERYFKGNFERLAIVKGKVDPDNYFWHEQSIPVLALSWDVFDNIWLLNYG